MRGPRRRVATGKADEAVQPSVTTGAEALLRRGAPPSQDSCACRRSKRRCATGTPAPPGALDATARARLLSAPAAAPACYLGAGSTRARHLPGCDNLATTPEAPGGPRRSPPAHAVAALASPAALAAAPRVPHHPRVVQRLAYRARGPPGPRASPATPAAAAQVAATPASPAALDVPPPMCCNLIARVNVGPHPGSSRPSRLHAGAPLGLRSRWPMPNPLYRRWYGASTSPDCRPGLFYQAAK